MLTELPPPDHDSPHNPRIRVRVGRCYELALNAVLQHPTWTLVQGVFASFQAEGIGHAWLERDGVAYDTTMGKFWDARAYEREFCATADGRWKAHEIATQLRTHRHCGPWVRDRRCIRWTKTKKTPKSAA